MSLTKQKGSTKNPRDIPSIAYLRTYAPKLANEVINLLGYASVNDGGQGTWVFDSTNNSTNVSSYPDLFIPTPTDLTGASGAWCIKWTKSIDTIRYGVGIVANSKTLLEEISLYNAVIGYDVILPRGSIYCSSLNLSRGSKFIGAFGATSSATGGSGTCLMFDTIGGTTDKYCSAITITSGGTGYVLNESIQLSNSVSILVTAVTSGVITTATIITNGFCYNSSLPTNPVTQTSTSGSGTGATFTLTWSAAPCITISGSPTSRVTGLKLKNISIIGKDYFSGDLITSRTNRLGLSLNYIGGQVDVKDIFIIGFDSGVRFNEVWDGVIKGMRLLYCVVDATYPAVWVGSQGTDNTNALTFDRLHVEHSPYMLYVETVRHTLFHGCKFETGTSGSITAPSIIIRPNSEEVAFYKCMYITNPISATYFMQDKGQRTVHDKCDFNSRNYTSTDTYTGMLWYDGSGSTAGKLLQGCYFLRLRPTDGTGSYPILLGNNDVATDCRVGLDTVHTVSGVWSIGQNCKVSAKTFANTTTKTAGALYHFNGTNAIVEHINEEGQRQFALIDGSRQNIFSADNLTSITTDVVTPEVAGLNLVYCNTASSLSVTGFNAMAGQVFFVSTTGSATTLVNSTSLVLLTGANTLLVANAVHQFICVNSSNKCVQIS